MPATANAVPVARPEVSRKELRASIIIGVVAPILVKYPGRN